MLQSVTDGLKIWNVDNGQELVTLTGKKKATDRVYSAAFRPDGKRILTGDDSGMLMVWDAATGQEVLALKGHTARVSTIAFSRDGKRIVSGSWDKTLKVWDAEQGQEVLTLRGHEEIVTGAAFSPPDNERIVSVSWNKTLRIWHAGTGQEVLTLTGHTDFLTSIAFSPDGKRIVSGSGDKTLKVWHADMRTRFTMRSRGSTKAFQRPSPSAPTANALSARTARPQSCGISTRVVKSLPCLGTQA